MPSERKPSACCRRFQKSICKPCMGSLSPTQHAIRHRWKEVHFPPRRQAPEAVQHPTLSTTHTLHPPAHTRPR
jgi:hypothetical protein